MKAFTLYELVITMFVLTMLFSISFKTPIFQKNVYYLPQETNRLANFLKLAQDTSFTEVFLEDKKLCAAGFRFKENEYIGVAFLTTEDDCEFLFNQKPDAFASTTHYLLENGSLSKDQNNPLVIKRKFDGDLKLKSGCSNIIDDALLLFISPYGEPALFIKKGDKWSLQENWPLCFSLTYRNEERQIKINQLGQILLQ